MVQPVVAPPSVTLVLSKPVIASLKRKVTRNVSFGPTEAGPSISEVSAAAAGVVKLYTGEVET